MIDQEKPKQSHKASDLIATNHHENVALGAYLLYHTLNLDVGEICCKILNSYLSNRVILDDKDPINIGDFSIFIEHVRADREYLSGLQQVIKKMSPYCFKVLKYLNGDCVRISRRIYFKEELYCELYDQLHRALCLMFVEEDFEGH